MLIYFITVPNCIQDDFLNKWHVQASISFLTIISLASNPLFIRSDIQAGNLLDLGKPVNQLPHYHH